MNYKHHVSHCCSIWWRWIANEFEISAIVCVAAVWWLHSVCGAIRCRLHQTSNLVCRWRWVAQDVFELVLINSFTEFIHSFNADVEQWLSDRQPKKEILSSRYTQIPYFGLSLQWFFLLGPKTMQPSLIHFYYLSTDIRIHFPRLHFLSVSMAWFYRQKHKSLSSPSWSTFALTWKSQVIKTNLNVVVVSPIE